MNDQQAPPPKPYRKIRWWLVILVSVVLGIILGLSDFFVQIFTRLSMIVTLLMIVVTLYLQVIVHELGHLALGTLGGYELYSFRVLWFALERENGVFRIFYRRAKGYSGLCLMFPPAEGVSKRQVLLFYSGGILANIVFSLACFLIGFYAPHSSDELRYFLLWSACWGVLFAALNSYPRTTRGNYKTDGRIILNLLRAKMAPKQAAAATDDPNVQLRNGARISSLDIIIKNDPATLTDPAARAILFLYRYYYFIDLSNQPEALTSLEAAEQLLPWCNSIRAEPVNAELLYIAACQQNTTKARQLYKELGSILRQGRAVTDYRIRAAYTWYILQKREEALGFIEKGYAVADKYMLKGMIPLERDLLKQLEEEMTNVQPTPTVQ